MAEMGWTAEEIYYLADRGYGFYRQGCYQEAAVVFDALTVLDPLRSYFRIALAAVCLALGDAQRAVAELSFVLNDNPADQDARARRCEANCQLGNWGEARQDLAILERNGARQHVERLTWRIQAGSGVASPETLATSRARTR